MHLHGFYFRVDAAGDGPLTSYSGRRAAPGGDGCLSGRNINSPTGGRPAGNWIFHCHFVGHIRTSVPWRSARHAAATWSVRGLGDPRSTARDGVRWRDCARHQVAQTSARAGGEPAPDRLLVRSKPNVYGEKPATPTPGAPPPRAETRRRCRRAESDARAEKEAGGVTVVNHCRAAAVRWHGIELELPDGVPG